jgi:hypothetical protein
MTPESILSGMIRLAEGEEDLDISAELKTLKSVIPTVIGAFEAALPELQGNKEKMAMLSGLLSEGYQGIVEAAQAEEATAAAEKAFAEEAIDKEVGEEMPAMHPSMIPGMSAQPEFAMASQEDKMERKASDFSHFDTSENKLEIVEGDGKDGKKKIIINKNLKNLVTKRIVEFAKGAHADGVKVHIDCDDHIAVGVIQSYIGNDSYSVRIEGRMLPVEVPSSRILTIENGLWG